MVKSSTSQPLHQVHDGKFSTYSDVLINLHKPTPEMFVVEDIAQALNNICRFGGQIDEFYSVLQHSLLVYALAPPELGGIALLHDATEAYLGDVIKPLKVMLGTSYEAIETSFQKAIFERFKLDVKDMASLKQYDKQALQIEHDYFFKTRLSPLKNIMEMFIKDSRDYGRMPICDPDYKKVYKDLVYEHFPHVLTPLTQTQKSA